MPKGIRKNITVPGILAPSLHLRCHECGFHTLSPFAVELVSYDLQGGAKHTITVAIASDTQAAQDAVDAEIVARYRPGQPREGLLVQVVERLSELRAVARDSQAPPLNAKPVRITLPARLWQIVDLRWQELGYASLSAYLTGLIRYDLLVGGPHRSQAPAVRRSAQDALARETVACRKKGQKRKLYLDHLIERTEGRPLEDRELEKIKATIADHLRALVLAP